MSELSITRRNFVGALAGAGVALQATSAANSRESDFAAAMQADISAIAVAASDPARPVYHFHPPANWNNDPNGTIWYKGWHHLFYQHNPYAAKWGHMHWGHARSSDLVNWEHLPIALCPSVERGETHIYSGGAVLAEDGRPRILYTSVGQRDPEQWLAIPEDDELIGWRKYSGNPIATLKIHGAHTVSEWRDPFPFREAGKTYMVCGGNLNAGRQGGAGAVQLYEALTGDLTRWKYRSVLFEYRDADVFDVECPNLFRLDSKWVLICSPYKSCEYFVGELDLNSGKFIAETRGILDPGLAYASNISKDEKGRTILWLWGRTNTEPEKGWNSCMVLPRILHVDDSGFLRQAPAPEFESLRGTVSTVSRTVLDTNPFRLAKELESDCLELEVGLSSADASAIGLRVRSGARNPGTEISFNPQRGMLKVGNIQKLIGKRQPLMLRLFLDKRVLEVYANDGVAAVFTTVDAGPQDLGIEVFSSGGPGVLESLRVWPLRPARFSLDRFKI